MNYRLILRLIGNALRIEALFMLFPMVISFIYHSGEHWAFIWSILVLAVISTLLTLRKPKNKNFRAKDAFFVAGFSWLLFSVFGAMPFYFSGCFSGVIDSIFESVSGFTTTGATILKSIESLPEGILFWRSFSHWIGGMGVLMFIMAVMPSINASSVNLLRAESTGPSPNKIVPKARETAKIMYLIYLVMTLLLFGLLCVTGLPVFDSLNNAFSTAGTGGVSIMNSSIGAYNDVAAEIVITVFMLLFGISFTLYFYLIGRNFRKVIKDGEFKLYLGIVAAAILLISLNISGMYGGFTQALRHSSFQVSSIISTTGFTTTDFNLWPTLSQIILLLLMITGCCAGSTGGGIKVIRILILMKSVRLELKKIFHPGDVEAVTINGKKVSREIVTKTAVFFFIYACISVFAVLLISIEGKDIVTCVSAVIASVSNIGPGLGVVGPAGNFSMFSGFSKIVLSLCMIAGRLEFYPILVLFTPAVWKKGLVNVRE